MLLGPGQRLAAPCALACALFLQPAIAATNVSVPSSYTSSNVVDSNFLGISVELSFLNLYVGDNASTIPPPAVQLYTNIQSRMQRPLRMRIGGNSMDSSTYVPDQQAMLVFSPNKSLENQPVTFGPEVFKTLAAISPQVGGAQYMLGLSIRDPNSTNVPLLAAASEKALGDKLESLIIGNEPDLYTAHGVRPDVKNYTVELYLGDFRTVLNDLADSPEGNLLPNTTYGGPTICCAWDLNTLLEQGYLADFKTNLTYITLQHYPQNNCQGKPQFGISYYLEHHSVVDLTTWQLPGVTTAKDAGLKVIMDEFNSASCGGVPGISDTFAATMWLVDYSLQMASVGYFAAYAHTQEPGVTYNLFDPPAIGNGSDFKVLPSYYAYLPVAEALQGANGSVVLDLDINNSTKADSTTAGYAVYDAGSQGLRSLTLFNYAVPGEDNETTHSFDIPALNTGSQNVTVRYLTAPNVTESKSISWGGQTLAGVSDGKFVASNTSPDKQFDCHAGCSIDVPAPGIALVFLNSSDANVAAKPTDGQKASASPSSHIPTIGSLLSVMMAAALGVLFS